jgi:hypothetical protein
MHFYRWPCGSFEVLGAPWTLMRYRPEPRTPSGDSIADFASKEACDAAVADLNERAASLEEARAKYGKREESKSR